MKNELEVARAEGQATVNICGMKNCICNLWQRAGGAAAACERAAVRAAGANPNQFPTEAREEGGRRWGVVILKTNGMWRCDDEANQRTNRNLILRGVVCSPVVP